MGYSKKSVNGGRNRSKSKSVKRGGRNKLKSKSVKRGGRNRSKSKSVKRGGRNKQKRGHGYIQVPGHHLPILKEHYKARGGRPSEEYLNFIAKEAAKAKAEEDAAEAEAAAQAAEEERRKEEEEAAAAQGNRVFRPIYGPGF